MAEEAKNGGESNRSHGGLIPDGEGRPAFELVQRRRSAIPVLIAIPHAGREYPDSLTERMRISKDSCLRLEDRLVDAVGREVAKQTGAALLVADAPRALIDLNRSPDDMDWSMVAGGRPSGLPRFAAGRRARSGLGLVPRRLSGVGEIWKRPMHQEELDARVELIHKPYHATLAHVLEHLRDRWGGALLVDLHSMPPLGPKTVHSQTPDFVIGDRYGSSCAAGLSLGAIAAIEGAGKIAAHNRPYAGGYVLDRHSMPARGLHALQIEICRSTYLDSDLTELGDGAEEVVEIVTKLVRKLAEDLISSIRFLPQAAE